MKTRIPDEWLRSIDPVCFWNRVLIGKHDECWPWTGPTHKAGYGIVVVTYSKNKRRNLLAHRIAYILGTGTSLNELDACHHCDNPPCCNYTTHLFAGTNYDNRLDSMNKGRASGPKKLTPSDVAEIKQRYSLGETSTDLERYYQVRARQIRRIVAGTSQKNDPTPLHHPDWKRNQFKNPQTRLSDEQIIDLRKQYSQGDVTQRELAAKYSIDQGYLSAIVNYKVRKLATQC